MASNLSGAAWWNANQAQFPNSSKVDDLVVPFRANVEAFITALRNAGATVHVNATLRDARRAHIMRNAWDIAHGFLDPKHVPAISGVDINWDHGSLSASRAAAQAMVDVIGIVVQPALGSLHIFGRAIDMNISWTDTIVVTDKTERDVSVGAPHDGGSNPTLHAIGATYGVKKLLSDPPHWSDTGH